MKRVYSNISSTELSFMISAHKVRALSASLAYWNAVSLDDMFRAAYWHSKCTYFCIVQSKRLTSLKDDLHNLGLLVTQQSFLRHC